MPWYLYLALKQLFPTGKRFPFFTAISMLGVALGVALLIISTSVMAGFGREIRTMIVDTQGDVQVQADGVIADPGAVRETIAEVPGVVGTTAYAEGPVLLRYQNRPAFPALRGIDPADIQTVIPINRYLIRGTLDDLDDDSVILSSQLAISLGVGMGETVEIFSPLLLENFDEDPDHVFLPRTLKVAGIFQIGHQALDSSLVLVTLRTMQDLYDLGPTVHGISVKIAPDADPDDVASRINARLPFNLTAHSWMDSNDDFLFILQLEKNMIFFLLLFIIVVAAFSVTSSLLISVVRKTREIGLLSALGGNSRQVAACFCFQGFVIGVAGTAFGVLMGLSLVHWRNDIVGVFTRLTQSEAALVRFYQFSNLPAYVAPSDLTTIIVCSIVISTLAGMLPAWRAARLNPVEALRSE